MSETYLYVDNTEVPRPPWWQMRPGDFLWRMWRRVRMWYTLRFVDDALMRQVQAAGRAGAQRVLFAYVKGLGDTSLSLYGLVQYVHQQIPGVVVDVIVRRGLEQAICWIPGVDQVYAVDGWSREDDQHGGPTMAEIGRALAAQGITKTYDLIIHRVNRGPWWRRQFGRLQPTLVWSDTERAVGERRIAMLKQQLGCSAIVTVQVETGTEHYYRHDREWPIERWELLFDQVIAEGGGIVVLGEAPRRALRNREQVIDLRGQTEVAEAVSVAVASDVFVALDSGLLCLIYYLSDIQAKVISLFGEPHGIYYRREPPTSRQLQYQALWGRGGDVTTISSKVVFAQIRSWWPTLSTTEAQARSTPSQAEMGGTTR